MCRGFLFLRIEWHVVNLAFQIPESFNLVYSRNFELKYGPWMVLTDAVSTTSIWVRVI